MWLFATIDLLFFIINLILRKRDLKAELNDYRRMGYQGAVKKGKGKQKEQPAGPKGPGPGNRPMNAQQANARPANG